MRELTRPEENSLLIDGKCPYCRNSVFNFGPRGGHSRNITCIACNARYNILMPLFQAQLIGEPTSDGSQGEPQH